MRAATEKRKTIKNQTQGQQLVRVTISVDPADYDAFEQLGEQARLSRSWLIRKAMREFLERHPDSKLVAIPTKTRK